MLYDITLELAQELGRTLTDSRDRAWLVQQVNNAARELYSTQDITGCEREQVFVLDVAEQQIALPWYVGDVIGVRDYDTRVAIEQVDMRPRYMRDSWSRISQITPTRQWRRKGYSALSREIVNEEALTITLPAAAPAAFDVVIVGSNSLAARVTERVQFAAGDVEKTTLNFFANVSSITKSAPTTLDLSVTTVSDVEVSSIPSHLKAARFMLVQVMDRGDTQAQSQLVEVCYKHIFEPFVNDTDVFVAGDITYDKAIVWKTLEHIWAKEEGKEERAAMAGNKAQAVLANIMSNAASKVELKFAFGPNPTLDALSASARDVTLHPRF